MTPEQARQFDRMLREQWWKDNGAFLLGTMIGGLLVIAIITMPQSDAVWWVKLVLAIVSPPGLIYLKILAKRRR